jgi:hypothetical protein
MQRNLKEVHLKSFEALSFHSAPACSFRRLHTQHPSAYIVMRNRSKKQLFGESSFQQREQNRTNFHKSVVKNKNLAAEHKIKQHLLLDSNRGVCRRALE